MAFYPDTSNYINAYHAILNWRLPVISNLHQFLRGFLILQTRLLEKLQRGPRLMLKMDRQTIQAGF